MKCGACQRDCRSTSLAYVAKSDGGMRRARVCGKCFDSAIHIVPSVTTVKKGVDETTVQRRESKDVTKGASKKLRAMAGAYRGAAESVGDKSQTGFAEGRATGLDQAADILEAGDY